MLVYSLLSRGNHREVTNLVGCSADQQAQFDEEESAGLKIQMRRNKLTVPRSATRGVYALNTARI